MGVIAGVTTNPSLIAKEGRDYAETLAEIATIVDGPISGEVKATTEDAAGMIAEGEAIYALDPKHMVHCAAPLHWPPERRPIAVEQARSSLRLLTHCAARNFAA